MKATYWQDGVGSNGNYWSSTSNYNLNFNSGGANTNNNNNEYSVRLVVTAENFPLFESL